MSTDFLSYTFEDTPEFINTFDEMPLWSASFGLLLLKHLELKPGLTVLDIGSGAGFPLLELAQRLGTSCKCYGLDPWTNANNRAKEKIRNYNVQNAEIIEGTADKIPFGDASVDLIVSNLGINNFDDPPKVFKECGRVLKPGGRLAITTNLDGHWKQFYDVFEETLTQTGNESLVSKLKEQQQHRGTVNTISKLFTNSGFNISRTYEEQFEMRFLDGSAFMNHYFVKLGWLASWKELIPADQREAVFTQLVNNLDAYAGVHAGLTLTVPIAYIEGERLP